MSPYLSTVALRSLLALAEKRESLLDEISKIDSEISDVLQNGTVKPSRNLATRRKPGRPQKAGVVTPKAAKKGKRGYVKELILAGLKEAGEAGLPVKHLAAKIGIKPGHIHVWFATTGKKTGLTEALGKGVYRLKESSGAASSHEPLDTPKPKTTDKAPTKIEKLKAKKKS